MKYITLILSIYFLALTTMPCIDKPLENNIQQGLSYIQSDLDDHQNCTACSPFCFCDCCVTPIFQQITNIRFDCLLLSEKINSQIDIIIVPSHLTSIWQPPKFC